MCPAGDVPDLPVMTIRSPDWDLHRDLDRDLGPDLLVHLARLAGAAEAEA